VFRKLYFLKNFFFQKSHIAYNAATSTTEKNMADPISGISTVPVRSNSDFKDVKLHVSTPRKTDSNDILEKTTALAEQVRKVKEQFEKTKSSITLPAQTSIPAMLQRLKGAVSELDNIAKQEVPLIKQNVQLTQKFFEHSVDEAQDPKILKLFREIKTNLQFFDQVHGLKSTLLTNIRQLTPKRCCFPISIDIT
jgi:predicted transcriptional regulator